MVYRGSIFIASIWNKKARLWVSGRKNIFESLSKEFQIKQSKITWFHCSSLGEFEQGRPVIEKIKSQYPDTKILLTFFSPSGYEIRKNYKQADWVFYLPTDSASHAKKFLDIVNPDLVIFVKYDFWYYYLKACNERKIPLLLISAIFRKNQPFFKWYGNLHRKMLHCFTCLFVQDEESKTLLQKLETNEVIVSGDTRMDRVLDIADRFLPIEKIADFCGNAPVLVAGSTWPADEKLLKEVSATFPDLKMIIAPHEIHHQHLEDLKKLFPATVFFSSIQTTNKEIHNSNCLVIDNIGMLSGLYFYATLTYIGGGFDQGIHNVLEAAVYGKPVIFGPRFEKFREASDLVRAGAGFSIRNKEDLENQIRLLLNDVNIYHSASKNAKAYLQDNKGATAKILQYIQENRLLTK